MCNEAAKVTSDYAVPGSAFPGIKLDREFSMFVGVILGHKSGRLKSYVPLS